MKFDKTVKYAIEDFRNYIDDTDPEFAYGTIDFLSNKPNSHMHMYSEEVIKEYAPTVLGKWLIGAYDQFYNDMETHVDKQYIQGVVPTNQEVKYRYDEDGYLVASVDVVISKLYSDVYKILRDDPQQLRNVSVEEMVGFTPETADLEDGVEQKDVVGFNICGITVLGKMYNPSVPNANVKLTQMSEDSISKINMAYAKYAELKEEDIKIQKEDSEEKMSQILEKLSEIESKLNKEETMANKDKVVKYAIEIGDGLWSKLYDLLREKYPMADGDWITSKYYIKGVYEEGQEKFIIVEEKDTAKMYKITFTYTESELTLSDQMTEVSVDFVEMSKMAMFSKEDFSKYEDKLKDKKEQDKPENQDEEEMACGDGEKEGKMADDEVKQMAEKMSAMEKELSELRKFKEDVTNSQKNDIVTKTMSSVKDYFDKETYEKFEQEGNACAYSEINAWANKVKANVTDIALQKLQTAKNSESEIVDLGLPIETNKQDGHKTIYDIY